MTTDGALWFLGLMEAHRVDVWLDGGWADVHALCGRFDIPPPDEYRGFAVFRSDTYVRSSHDREQTFGLPAGSG